METVEDIRVKKVHLVALMTGIALLPVQADADPQVVYRGTAHVVTTPMKDEGQVAEFSLSVPSVVARSGTSVGGKVEAAGGSAPYSYTFAEGSRHPSWLVLDGATGLLSGTAVTGTHEASVVVVDRAGATLTRPLSIEVFAPLIASSQAIASTPGQAVSVAPTVSGGLAPYSFEWVTPADERPSWLNLDASTGRVSGTTATGAWERLAVRVSDRNGGESFSYQFGVDVRAAAALASSTFPGQIGSSSTGSSAGVGDHYSAQYTLFAETHTWYMSVNRNGHIELVYDEPVEFDRIKLLVHNPGNVTLRYRISFVSSDGESFSRDIDRNSISTITETLGKTYKTQRVRISNIGSSVMNVGAFSPGGLRGTTPEVAAKSDIPVVDRVSAEDMHTSLPPEWKDMDLEFLSIVSGTAKVVVNRGREIVFDKAIQGPVAMWVRTRPKANSPIWRKRYVTMVPAGAR